MPGSVRGSEQLSKGFEAALATIFQEPLQIGGQLATILVTSHWKEGNLPHDDCVFCFFLIIIDCKDFGRKN